MENGRGEMVLFNVNAAKLMGLYQILDPETVKIRGHNAYHVAVALSVLYLGTVSTAISANGVYYWNVARTTSIMCLVTSISFVHVCYKVLVVVYHSDAIWDCLSVVCSDSAAFSAGDDRGEPRRAVLLRAWRNRSVRVMYAYGIAGFLPLFVYAVSPLVLNDTTIAVDGRDGGGFAAGNYRLNVLNSYSLALFDDAAYNAYFGWFYCVELACTLLYLLFCFIFDTVFVTLSMAVVCQLQVIGIAFESFGRKSRTRGGRHGPSAAVHTKNEKKTSEEYDDLRNIIIGHQTIIQKLRVFVTIFRPVMFIQIVMSSVDIIFDWFTFTLCFIDKETADSGTSTMKMLCLLPLFSFQLILPCYAFGHIQDQKDSIIFSLYNSNWTEMDLKCKELILMKMGMNNAHQLKLKLSPQKIINLEMFVGTVRVLYTIFSILLKYK